MSGLIDLNGRKLQSQAGRKCDVGECQNSAAYVVGALLWAHGLRKGSHEPKPIMSNLACCEAHKSFPTIKNCFSPEAQFQISENFIRSGIKPPDFSTAEILLAPIRK